MGRRVHAVVRSLFDSRAHPLHRYLGTLEAHLVPEPAAPASGTQHPRDSSIVLDELPNQLQYERKFACVTNPVVAPQLRT